MSCQRKNKHPQKWKIHLIKIEKRKNYFHELCVSFCTLLSAKENAILNCIWWNRHVLLNYIIKFTYETIQMHANLNYLMFLTWKNTFYDTSNKVLFLMSFWWFWWKFPIEKILIRCKAFYLSPEGFYFIIF